MNNELQHHGIKGMRWGVRRNRNSNSNSNSSNSSNPNRRKPNLNKVKRVVDASSEMVDRTQNVVKKKSKPKVDLSKMSDNELRAVVNRMDMERRYAQLSENQVSKGRQYATSILEGAGTALTVTSSILGVALAIKELKG